MNRRFWDSVTSQEHNEFAYLYNYSPSKDYFSRNFNIIPTRSILPNSKKKKNRKDSNNIIQFDNLDIYFNRNINNHNYNSNDKRLKKFFNRNEMNDNRDRHVIDAYDPVNKVNKLFCSPKEHMKMLKIKLIPKGEDSKGNDLRHHRNRGALSDVNIFNKYTHNDKILNTILQIIKRKQLEKIENNKEEKHRFNNGLTNEKSREQRHKEINNLNQNEYEHENNNGIKDDSNDYDYRGKKPNHGQSQRKAFLTMRNEQNNDYNLPPISKSTKDLGVKHNKNKKKGPIKKRNQIHHKINSDYIE